ncbi:homoserine kinase [Longibacter salinarum]|uniref:Homoserine kinase n=1 Tax=Longibacter salinarum TaxID=1850348 RepID=A0A2A8CYG0_9BACT|nr:homoserine kinase [Longibacter salinarum]
MDGDVATAYAPSSVGNVAVGYDVLGCIADVAGDRVTVRRLDEPVVRLGSVSGLVTDLPSDPEENTATAGLLKMITDLNLDYGFEVCLEKGIPLGSGMGGSAASAVGAAVAANAVLDDPMPLDSVFRYALVGEAVASGAVHPDNVAPSLYGGVVLTRSVDPPDVISVPVPEELRCVLVHPDRSIATRDARARLPNALKYADIVRQTAHIGAFIAGCYKGDIDLIGRSLRDFIVEPYRAALIPGFADLQRGAMDAGALGCSLAGAGPSCFAWTRAEDAAEVQTAMQSVFSRQDIPADAWITRLDAPGARIV